MRVFTAYCGELEKHALYPKKIFPNQRRTKLIYILNLDFVVKEKEEK